MTRWLMLFGLLVTACATEAARDRGAASTSRTVDALERVEARTSRSVRLVPRWQVFYSPNFRIYYPLSGFDPTQFAVDAEQTRQRLLQQWSVDATRVWRPVCDIYLYPTRDALVVATGGHDRLLGQAQSRPARLTTGQLLERRVDLALDDEGLLASTLPHELTHIIVAAQLSEMPQIPVWVQEGLAMLAEDVAYTDRHLSIVRQALLQDKAFRFADLVRMHRYPDDAYLSLFYAQSFSVVRMLVALGDQKRFIDFVRVVRRSHGDAGIVAALMQFYRIESLQMFDQLWRESLR